MTKNITQPKSFKGGPRLGDVMTPLQLKIIKEWQKKILVHPSHSTIANKLSCSEETVQRAIKKYLSLNK